MIGQRAGSSREDTGAFLHCGSAHRPGARRLRVVERQTGRVFDKNVLTRPARRQRFDGRADLFRIGQMELIENPVEDIGTRIQP